MSSHVGKIIRILIVDDHAILRGGLRMLIESREGMQVVGEADGRSEAIAIAEREQPDIILLDIDLGGLNSLSFMREMLAAAPRSRVIILTGVRDQLQYRRAVQIGAMGLVLKEKASDVLLKAIEKVHTGEVWLDRHLTAAVLSDMSNMGERKTDPESAKISQLTPREREIIKLVCEGLRNKQVSERLFISEATVRNHLTSILGKLGLIDRFDLALFSYKHGLGTPPDRF